MAKPPLTEILSCEPADGKRPGERIIIDATRELVSR